MKPREFLPQRITAIPILSPWRCLHADDAPAADLDGRDQEWLAQYGRHQSLIATLKLIQLLPPRRRFVEGPECEQQYTLAFSPRGSRRFLGHPYPGVLGVDMAHAGG